MATTHLKAIVTGMVWKIERQAGERVEAGEVVMILESMKMEIPLEAQAAGIVRELLVAEGEAVTEGQQVAVLIA